MARQPTARRRTHRAPLILGLVALLTLGLVAACTGSRQGTADPGGQGTATASPSKPIATGDEFVANGATGEAIGGAVADLIAQDPTRSYDDMRLMVWLGDEVVLTYSGGSTVQDSENVASVTKSMIGLLIGIALDRGDLPGLDATVAELLPGMRDQMASGVGDVTLAQLLTHTGGLRGDEAAIYFERTNNWVATILSEPLEAQPGETFAYSSAGSHLLAAILAEQTGQPVLGYAQRHLFGPLGLATTPATEVLTEITPENVRRYQRADFAWPHDHQGYHAGYAWLKLNPADMATIGRMMLADGTWAGRQVVPQDWVRESTTEHATDGDIGYGYQWWVTTADRHPAFLAGGYGGQLIEVVPDLNLVVTVLTPIPTAPSARSTWPAMASMVDLLIAPQVS